MCGRKPKKYKHPTAPRQANHRMLWMAPRLELGLQSGYLPATIGVVENVNQPDVPVPAGGNPFRPGVMVLVTLGNPREKFWGAILSLASEGLSLCGDELGFSFDDLISLIKDGEPFSPGVVFVPMHRVERMELRPRLTAACPSLSQRFASKTGLDPASRCSYITAESIPRRPGGQK